MLRAVTSLVAPPLCAICDAPVGVEERVCRRCRRELLSLGPVRLRLGAMEVICASRYEGVARRLIAKLKFSARLALVEVAADAMVAAWQRDGVLVPVPGAPSRTRWRGFDTAWCLSGVISRRAGSRCSPCLEREDGPRQVGRPREDRIGDPPRIRLAKGPGVPDEHVWLVDDVVTTGATLRACERVLRAAGVEEVSALVFARADSLGPEARAA